MKVHFIRYLAGLVFVALGIFEFVENHDLPETLLYLFLGASFLLMGYIAQYPETPYKRNLNILSWILILGAAFSFLYVLTIPGSGS